ncbi:DUF4349 domain-containing protein [Streptomyces sp. B1I3]|uniref:DUF4349 domain-containing protein n=1 Tax=Streptomyces sp. B1I3 TaxID=3042264 RepID=UPI0027823B7B|nr:DUF4349 domain-containing protein [Streptomyces sp. B1I3]MDQ0793243.1 hypothetical protein [Streptomyces sp. B1I3]
MHFARHTDSRPPARSPRRRPRAVIAAGLLAVLLTATACGAGDSGGSADGSKADQKAAAPEAAGPGSEASEADGADSSGDAGRQAAGKPAGGKAPAPGAGVTVHVIRTAALDVEVKSVPKAVAAARGAAEGAGGLVADERTERVDDTHEMSHLVLRVPQDRYESVLRTLAGSGKLLSRTSGAKDVTGQVVDVESRISTQRASVARVRSLMDKAERLSDVVTLEGELSSRQADLESLLAQQASLKDRTSLATITLDLREPYEDGKDAEDEEPGFLDALGAGWDAFVAMVRWIALAVGATAPFLATAAALVLVWRLLRGRRTLRRSTPTAPAPAAVHPAPGPEVPPAP